MRSIFEYSDSVGASVLNPGESANAAGKYVLRGGDAHVVQGEDVLRWVMRVAARRG